MYRALRIFFFILLAVDFSVSYKILVLLPYPGKSHQMVYEPLLDELTDRGHQLTVVSFFPKENPLRNRRDVSLIGVSEIFKEVVDIKIFEKSMFGLEPFLQHVPLVTNLALMAYGICEKLTERPNLQEFWRGEGDYDLIIYEAFNSDCMLPLVRNYGLPFVGLMSSELLPWTPDRLGFPDTPSYVPDMMVGMAGNPGFYYRFVNTVVHYFYKFWFNINIRTKEQVLLEKKYNMKLPLLEEIGKNVSAILINTYFAFNGVKVTVPSLIQIGGIHLKKNSSQLPEILETFLNQAPSPGVILFSFGSLVKGTSLPKHRLRAFLEVFAKLPHRIIWKWEGDILPNLPDNVMQMRWVPQNEVLAHPKCVAFITHGGLLSLTEAVYHAKPVLVIPLLGDQFLNAAQAERTGFGNILPYKEIDEESLEKALNITLSKEKRDNAKKISEIWRDRPMDPMAEAIYWIERTARYGFNIDLSSHVRHMPFYQQAMLDIFAFILFIVAILFTIVVVFVKFVVNIIRKHNFIKLKVS